ncbi:MAG: BrnA antitoxin family protein [Rhodospirillales bacterium]|nr:BrnA antitoxin family protein [Rhodospirillales bacterium]
MSDETKLEPLKPLPRFASDDEAERFVENADLSRYDLSGFKPAAFEFEPKSARVNMRLPAPLLAAVKERARARGVPYQRFIREAIERALTDTRPS